MFPRGTGLPSVLRRVPSLRKYWERENNPWRKKLKFEEAMRRLQEIVGKLESGEVSLEESMKLFEEGAKLSSQCYQLLDKAEQQVIQLAKIPLEEEVQDEEDI